jgi:hypothetical protein
MCYCPYRADRRYGVNRRGLRASWERGLTHRPAGQDGYPARAARTQEDEIARHILIGFLQYVRNVSYTSDRWCVRGEERTKTHLLRRIKGWSFPAREV